MLKNVGTIRLIDPSLATNSLLQHCTALETEISFSQKGTKGDAGTPGAAGAAGGQGIQGAQGVPGLQGIQGQKGDTGEPGLKGDKGDKGDIGATGPAGTASLASLTGQPCTTRGGVAGTLEVLTSPTDVLTFHCAAPGTGGVPTGTCNDLIINEVQTGAVGNPDQEFVELYNTCSTGVSVGGWKLWFQDATGAVQTLLADIPTTTIPGHGFFLLTSVQAGDLLGTPDATFGAFLVAAGGTLGLNRPDGSRADGVGWGTGLPGEGVTPAVAPGVGRSIARIPNGTDTNRNVFDFQEAITPTPRATNS
jgi:hypothetical protein